MLSDGVPLVLVHGGPGESSYSIERFDRSAHSIDEEQPGEYVEAIRKFLDR